MSERRIKMKIKVMIRDGIIDTVLGDKEALESDLEVEIVDYDRNLGDEELFNKHYDEEGMSDIPHLIDHCEEETEE